VTKGYKLLISGFLCGLFLIAPVNAAMGDVILSFEAQAHNSTGLTWADGYLWNIGHGHNIPADLLKLDPSDGSELLKLTLPIEHVMGLTWDGSSFWAVSHEDSIIYELNSSDGSIISSFPSPNPGTVETGCEGMAWDGEYLWYADSDLDRIFQLNSTDGTEVYSFSSPGSKPQGLAWDGSDLWHFDQITDLVYKLNPADGSIILSFSAPGNGQGDLAWDGTYLWMSRNGADRIYKINITNAPIAIAGEDQSVFEGDVMNFNGSASFDPDGDIETYHWDFDANVDTDGDGNTTNDVNALGPTPAHIYGDNGVYIVTLNVTDMYGSYSVDTCNITVNNLLPIINLLGPFTVEEGESFIIDTTADDPGSDDLTFIWSWGDGTSDNITVYYNNGMGNDPYPSPNGTFPFSKTDMVWHIYEKCGIYLLNVTVVDDDGGISVYSTNVTVITVYPPTLYINVSQNGKDIILHWDPPQIPAIDHYLIYRSTHQTSFDFNTVWKNTSIDQEPFESTPIPLRTMWNDTNAAYPENLTNYQEQNYYSIRAVNSFGSISGTSRTVGKWTRQFSEGISSFSLPLEPLENAVPTAEFFLYTMNATYIRWLDPTEHIWIKHGDGESNDATLEVGRGYEVAFDISNNYTFCGMPGAMINYDNNDGFEGFDPDTDAKELSVFIMLNGDVSLSWTEPGYMDSGDWYEVYNSTTRDGFFGTLGIDYFLACPPLYFGNNTAIHSCGKAHDPGHKMYYMIVPFKANGIRGASTYSLGIWTQDYQDEYDTLGIPMKLSESHTTDWYCDYIPDTVGINYLNVNLQLWQWHSNRMPQGAFDPVLEMTYGYQISTSMSTKFTFIGI
jgi:hypothetical protein